MNNKHMPYDLAQIEGRNNMNNKLNFIVKTKTKSNADISISLVGKKDAAVCIIFRNGTDRDISKTGYVTVAVSGERLYFKGETDEVGFKMSHKSSESTCKTIIRNDELIDFALTHSGDYRLKYDREMKLYYVDTE